MTRPLKYTTAERRARHLEKGRVMTERRREKKSAAVKALRKKRRESK